MFDNDWQIRVFDSKKGQPVKRSRRGGRRPQNGPNGHNGGNGGGSSSSGGGYNPNRVYDSNGPEIKIRGTATHVYEKYLQLARDSNASGDRIVAESYLQHAEHYFRIMAATQAQAQQYQQQAPQQPSVCVQPRQPSGTEDQPYIEQPSPQTSAPSFSLNETAGSEDEEEEEGEEVDAQE